ncbi:hypothetical protein X975_25093, partial [Stegodyphus mimosarum]
MPDVSLCDGGPCLLSLVGSNRDKIIFKVVKKRFRSGALTQQRKSKNLRHRVAVNDIVLVGDEENIKRINWCLGRNTELVSAKSIELVQDLYYVVESLGFIWKQKR